MILVYDYSESMSRDILFIDKHSFNEIPYSTLELSNRMKKTPNYSIYVKYINEEPVGYIGLLDVQTPHYSGVWVDLIAVVKQYQNQKIAQHMLKDIIEILSEKNVHLFTALVRETNISSLKAFKKNIFKEENNSFKLLYLDKN